MAAALEHSKETIAMRVVDALRDDIITMALKPGDVISESASRCARRSFVSPSRACC
jgi:DNA-binding GntR family transcriptional regulator